MHSVLHLQATTYCACWLSLKLPLILLVMSEGCCAEWGCAAPLYTCAERSKDTVSLHARPNDIGVKQKGIQRVGARLGHHQGDVCMHFCTLSQDMCDHKSSDATLRWVKRWRPMRPLGSMPFTAFSTMRSGSLCMQRVHIKRMEHYYHLKEKQHWYYGAKAFLPA